MLQRFKDEASEETARERDNRERNAKRRAKTKDVNQGIYDLFDQLAMNERVVKSILSGI